MEKTAIQIEIDESVVKEWTEGAEILYDKVFAKEVYPVRIILADFVHKDGYDTTHNYRLIRFFGGKPMGKTMVSVDFESHDNLVPVLTGLLDKYGERIWN